jgi:hypothetical protein
MGGVALAERAMAGRQFVGGRFVSIVRVGLAETKNFADGYDAIFGKKKGTTAKKAKPTLSKGASIKKKKKAKKK